MNKLLVATVIILVIVLAILVVYILIKIKGIKIDGEVVIEEKEGGGKLYSLELHVNPDEIDNRDTVTFRVRK